MYAKLDEVKGNRKWDMKDFEDVAVFYALLKMRNWKPD